MISLKAYAWAEIGHVTAGLAFVVGSHSLFCFATDHAVSLHRFLAEKVKALVQAFMIVRLGVRTFSWSVSSCVRVCVCVCVRLCACVCLCVCV